MANSKDPDGQTFSNQETEARREATLKVMLATPHKPHKTKGGGSSRRRP